MDESNVLDSSFLERMNTLLANGEVPGLFEGDEYTTLMTQCKEGAIRDGLMQDSAEELYKWFTSQVCLVCLPARALCMLITCQTACLQIPAAFLHACLPVCLSVCLPALLHALLTTLPFSFFVFLFLFNLSILGDQKSSCGVHHEPI